MEGLKDQADQDLVIMLVGNKIDLCEKNPQMRKVTKEQAMNFAHEKKLLFEETSAITDQNVTEAFEHLLQGAFLIVFSSFCDFVAEICTLKSKTGESSKRTLVIKEGKQNNNASSSNCKFC